MAEKAYTIIIEARREVEVIGASFRDAKATVKEMYNSGDACAELGDATFAVGEVRELD